MIVSLYIQILFNLQCLRCIFNIIATFSFQVLCASNQDHSVVEPLIAPEGAKIGESVTFAGYEFRMKLIVMIIKINKGTRITATSHAFKMNCLFCIAVCMIAFLQQFLSCSKLSVLHNK